MNNWMFENMIELFNKNSNYKLLLSGKWGLEKESLRITKYGDLALTDHPEVFGDKLKNPNITTDFSESQIEMITPPFSTIEKTYNSLKKIQNKVENGINDELLWPLSMPCRLPDEKLIKNAKYNNTQEGKENEIYRNGLALRYGKKMQMISGIHYNFSFNKDILDLIYNKFANNNKKQSFINELYFAIARNVFRFNWLIIYLFGASPVIDDSYQQNVSKYLKEVNKCCPNIKELFSCYKKNSTSLRMSRFGYSSELQDELKISYNSLAEYINDLKKALNKRNKMFTKLGLYKNGKQIQLNENLLQKESEYYSPVRFKQKTNNGERLVDALEKKGVQYLELRTLDLNPYNKMSVNLEQLYFIHIFILYCLFEQSNNITFDEYKIINKNHHLTTLLGRKKNIKLFKDNKKIKLKKWGKIIFEKMRLIAMLLDNNNKDNRYLNSLNTQYKKLNNIKLLPSSMIYKEMKKNKESFIEFGIKKAKLNFKGE